MATTILEFHLTVAGTMGAGVAEQPLVMENVHLSLRFDAGTGAWTSLVDKRTGGDLVVAGMAPVSVAPASPRVLDSAQVAIDLLWLLPTWDHGDGSRWNLYAPFDHFQVDRLLGTADDSKTFSRACAASNIRLMFDLVPHGPPDFTSLANEHPLSPGLPPAIGRVVLGADGWQPPISAERSRLKHGVGGIVVDEPFGRRVPG